MPDNERLQDYLKKAEEADAQAEKADDPAAKEAWHRIAASYRDLADMRTTRPKIWNT